MATVTNPVDEIASSLKRADADLRMAEDAAEKAYREQVRAFEADHKRIRQALDALGHTYRKPGRPRKNS